MVQAKLFIDERYAEPLCVDNIADEAFYSKYHFIRLFRKIYGKTPHQYLIQVRLNQAVRLLQQKKSVSDACFQVGFESVSSFSDLFSKYMGISPTAYASTHQQRSQSVQEQPLKYIPGCFAQKNGWIEKSQF